MVDSTNAEVPGFTTSERELTPAIDEVFRAAPRRVVVSSFASHIHRIQQVLHASHASGRRVGFVGRSMVRNMAIAQDLGYLQVPEGLVVSLQELDRLPDRQVALVCTGSQGEPMAALARMVQRDHLIRLAEGDTVLLASSLIPGNESAIYTLINDLSRLGAHVVHSGNAHVHVSGHASAGELAYVFNIVRPRHVLPVHGEWRHQANAAIAARTGVAPDRILLGEDGTVVDLLDGRAEVVGSVPAAHVYVDGDTVGGATEQTLTDRRTLAQGGVVTVLAIIDVATGRLAESPDIVVKGFVQAEFGAAEVEQVITDALARPKPARKGSGGGPLTSRQAEQVIERAVHGWLRKRVRRVPLIIVMVVEEDG